MNALKRIVVAMFAMLFVPVFAFSDDAKPAEERPAPKKEAQAKPAPVVEAKQVLEVFEALGAVADVFAGAAGGEVVGGDPLEQQFLQQFRQLSTTELNFVRTVCRPNEAQYKRIKAAGDVGLKTAVKKFAEIQKKLQQGMRAGEQPEWPDPRRLMSNVLLASVKETLSAEQAKRYEAELEKRASARKRAALLNFVARVDKDLVLTAEQRDKLTEALNSNWKDSWCQQLEVFMYGDTYMPVLPDTQVLPILTEKQKVIWNGIPKNQNMIWGWAGFGFGVAQAVEIDEGFVDVEVKVEEATKPEEKKDEKP